MNTNLFSLKEMAERVGIHPETLRRYYLTKKVRGYKLPGKKRKGALRFDPTEVFADLRKKK